MPKETIQAELVHVPKEAIQAERIQRHHLEEEVVHAPKVIIQEVPVYVPKKIIQAEPAHVPREFIQPGHMQQHHPEQVVEVHGECTVNATIGKFWRKTWHKIWHWYIQTQVQFAQEPVPPRGGSCWQGGHAWSSSSMHEFWGDAHLSAVTIVVLLQSVMLLLCSLRSNARVALLGHFLYLLALCLCRFLRELTLCRREQCLSARLVVFLRQALACRPRRPRLRCESARIGQISRRVNGIVCEFGGANAKRRRKQCLAATGGARGTSTSPRVQMRSRVQADAQGPAT